MLRPLLFAFAFTILASSQTLARVGVTSQTDGDPLGKPPTEAERVLRVGIDIQANEVVTTKADDRAHIVFLDGTSITVAPNARLVIDKFVYDPDKKKGELTLSVATGVFRLVGGKISKTNAIHVNTPAATMGIRGGIGLFVVTPQETKAHFLYGVSLTVTGANHTEVATRPGSLIVTRAGAAPGAPVVVPNGALAEALRSLEGRGGSGNNDTAADEEASKSGFSAQNSERGVDGRGGPAGTGGNSQQALSEADRQRGTGDSKSTTATTTPFFASGAAAGGSAGPVSGTSPLASGPVGGSTGGGGAVPPPTGHPQAIPAIGVGRPGGFVAATPANPKGR